MSAFWLKLYVLIRRHLHGANLLLLILIAATLANSLLVIQATNRSEQLSAGVDFRVLDHKPDNYNRFIYFVWHNDSVWQLHSPSILEIGREYSAVGKFQLYSFSEENNTFEQSSLSLGVAGYIQISKNFIQKEGCDFVCHLLKTVQNARFYTENVYLSASCRDFIFISKIFAPNSNCQDVFALSYGLVLGGTQKFSRELYIQIKNLGLTHLVAVSGFQVILIITFLENIVIRLNIPRKWRIAVFLFGVCGLVALVGPQPPVLRSSISVLLSLSVLIFLGRRVSSFRSLVYSGLILLWFNPFYLASISFQLSFLASLGLILANRSSVHTETTVEWLKNYKELSITSLATFLMTLPIIIKLSGKVTFLAVLTNILVLPFIPLISLLNILGLIPVIGQIPLAISIFLQSLIITFITELDKLPLSSWLSVSLESWDIKWVIIYYIFLLMLSFWYKNYQDTQPASPSFSLN